MVGGFPQRRPVPAKIAEVPTVAAEDVEFDEDGRLRISKPLAPAPTRPLPSYARPLPPMPTAPKPTLPKVGGLPLVPRRPTAPTVKREGELPPTKAATPATAAVKPPPTPYVRKPPSQYLDPKSIPYDPPRNYRGR